MRDANTSARQRLLHWLMDRLSASHYFGHRLREQHRELFVGALATRVQGVPYSELPDRYRLPGSGDAASKPGEPREGRTPIFVSGRFRSGSTFLWNLFRHTEGVTAYYEPLNERQWFRTGVEEDRVDPTHLGVGEYWREYAGLRELAEDFDPAWTTRGLYMDRRSCDEGLYRYLARLIASAPQRPVLQCNRFDFRLEWLKASFPGAKVVFLYRDPREQWMSVQKGGPPVPADYRLGVDDSLDLFYTLEWARDLRRVFPCLDLREHSHPYSVHYMLWRLAYLFGTRYADVSVAYEDLVGDFRPILQAVFDSVGLPVEVNSETYHQLLQPRQEQRWPGYAHAGWFRAIEERCDRMLETFFQEPERV